MTNNDKPMLIHLWLSMSTSERKQQFIDSRTAAENVGVSQRTIRAWIDYGLIDALRIGKKHRIYTKSLMDYVVSCSEE
jgi:excisionase family DNA binding protein